MANITLSDIEILSHCDVTRLHRAYLMAKTMPEELKITLVIGYKDEKDKLYPMENKPSNIDIHFEPYDPQTIYPTNRFRNIAFVKSSRPYVFYLDVDFVFQHDFWSSFTERYLPLLGEDKVLCPIPLFDELKPAYLDAYEADTLVKTETEETHAGILDLDFTQYAELFKFHDRWVKYPQEEELQDMTPVMRSIRNGTLLPEPWGILHRSRYLMADESFLGRVKDKQQFVCRLLDSGLRFYSMKHCVMYHLWHPDSRHDINREKENCVNTLLFNRRYLHKYQNFFFQLEEPSLEEPLKQLLAGFGGQPPLHSMSSEYGPDQIIPQLKKRETIINHGEFCPEYSVYGYKLIYVYHSEGNRSELKGMGNESEAMFNLGYFSLALDLNRGEDAAKMLQDLTGWPLNDSGLRVDQISPRPDVLTALPD